MNNTEKHLVIYDSNKNKVSAIWNDTENRDFVLIMVHGFNSSKNHKYFLPLVDRFAKKGISTFRFDTYGQGESDGKLEDLTVSKAIDDILVAVKFVRDQGYKNIGLLGTSFGGFASILVAKKIPELKLLALKSPVSDYKKQVQNIATKEDLANWKEKGYINYGDAGQFVKLNYSFYEDLLQYDAYQEAKQIQVPVLIIHGNADKTVNIEQSQLLETEFPNAKLVVIEGAGHGYSEPKQAEQMLNAIYQFIVQNA